MPDAYSWDVRRVQELCNGAMKWKAFSALLTFCEGNPPVTGGFTSIWPVMRSVDISFDGDVNSLIADDLNSQLAHVASI